MRLFCSISYTAWEHQNQTALLLDMVIALQKISRFTQGLNETMFLTNDLVQSAVIREFQILGEAAR